MVNLNSFNKRKKAQTKQNKVIFTGVCSKTGKLKGLVTHVTSSPSVLQVKLTCEGDAVLQTSAAPSQVEFILPNVNQRVQSAPHFQFPPRKKTGSVVHLTCCPADPASLLQCGLRSEVSWLHSSRSASRASTAAIGALQ